jgi:hypothetical protein
MRALSIAGLVWLGLAPCMVAEKKPKPAPPPRPAPAGRAGLSKGAAKLNNPALPVQRLLQMTPEQRERALSLMPPQQQERIRQRLEVLDRLPQAEKERRLQQLEALASLPPREQNTLRRHIQTFNNLPADRRMAMRREIAGLRRMPERDRQARLASDDFKNAYIPAEREMLSDLARNYPFAGR